MGLHRMMMDEIQRIVLQAKNDGSVLVIERARDRIIGTMRCYQHEDGFYTTDIDDERGFYGPIYWDEVISVSIQA